MTLKKRTLFFSIFTFISLFIVLWKQFNTTKLSLVNNTSDNRVKACYVVLVRNSELDGIIPTMRQIEDTFNKKYNYPYVFLNNEPFTPEFMDKVRSSTNSDVLFGEIDQSMWGYPDHINQTYAAERRKEMEMQGVPYGSSESYRHMCRFQSGFFFRHPLLDQFNYYWRLEPYVDYYCQINYDVFRFMKENRKKYGFNMALKEHVETIPTLWDTVLNFTKSTYPHLLDRNDSLLRFITNDGGLTYNTCHAWSNFEIGDLSLWRSKEYLALFDHLDQSGGFFYERWGDAPVHTIAAVLLLKKHEIHFFNDIGYRHSDYTHCPVQQVYRTMCSCDPDISFDFNQNKSCLPLYLDAMMN
ncbi:glycosyl transferase [Rhizopus microsporus var. microsporus]|uniref:Glycosyl transferase n=1 Tax=Rhizopus microsporus var. microsporus TaxID=86635 RepID=A0A1X0QXT1_RHIZD|nr:glycosyl transferase [Rhizopus microsporus var. microsporus]